MTVTRVVKRACDLLGASVLLVVTAPLMVTVAILVWARIGRPVLFRQIRPGLHGRPFEMLKFRSMLDVAGSDGRPLPDADRLTPFGRFLRSTSLDELPELLNVVRGEMSLVGPRPLLMEYLPLYTAEQARRHLVLPGITGWVQVNGRNALDWEQKFAMDVWYVDNLSLWLDARILMLTAVRVVQRRGIAPDGRATTEAFKGSRR